MDDDETPVVSMTRGAQLAIGESSEVIDITDAGHIIDDKNVTISRQGLFLNINIRVYKDGKMHNLDIRWDGATRLYVFMPGIFKNKIEV